MKFPSPRGATDSFLQPHIMCNYPKRTGTKIYTEIPFVSHLANDHSDLSLGCVTVTCQLVFLNHLKLLVLQKISLASALA